jgi:hypothetical protein
MTDNSNAFGEHRWRGKGCAYEVCVHTPLLVYYPGQQGRKVTQLVSNVDIAPTFADIAGTRPGSPVDGRSIVPLLTGQAPTNWPDEVLLHFRHDTSQETPPTFWAVRTQRYKYIETVPGGDVELYDLSNDPYEVASVAGKPAYAQEQASLRQRLTGLRNASPHGSTAPETSISDGPSGLTNDATPTFTFGSSKPGSAFQCRVTPAVAWTNCTSPARFSGLADGAHTFQVRAIDSGGNTDPTPAARGFTLDTLAPGTRITKRPKLRTIDRTPTLRFAAIGALDLDHFECAVDARPFKLCTSPKTVRPRLSFRRHVFRVRAVDKAGNADTTPARALFKVKRKR